MTFLPMNLKIGHCVYMLEEQSPLTDERGELLCGFCSNTNQRILINRDLPPCRKVDTVIHEIIHAVFYVYGWNTVKQLEEEQCTSAIATGLALIFRDNPTLLEALKDLLTLEVKI